MVAAVAWSFDDERVGRILDHVSDGIYVVDSEWRFLHVNEQAARLLRRDASELIGRGIWEEFPEAAGTEFWDIYHRALESQESQTFEAHYGPLDGWFEVRVFPAPEGLTVYFRDVTERREADEERKSLISRLTGALRLSEQLLELTDALGATLTPQEVADLVTKHAQRSLGCLFAGLALVDELRSVMRYVSMAPLPDEVRRKWAEFPLDARVPATDCLRAELPTTYATRSEILEDYPHIDEDLEAAGTKAMATLPLVASGETIGALMVTWSQPHECDEEELRFLQTLAGQAAQALERARMFDRQRSVAATLQQAILPRDLPEAAGVDLVACYEPAETGVDVGGDWYDAFELPDGRLALTVGDVGGHGLDAAGLMGQLRNAARAYAMDDPEPGALVTKLNRLLSVSGQADALLATIVVAALDPRSGRLRWSSAGHPPPLVVAPNGTSRLLELVHGPPLGAEPAVEYAQAEDEIAGESLLLYTDGLIEHRGRSLTDGLRMLREVAASVAMADPKEFCDAIAEQVLPGIEREDDLCALMARHRPD